MGGHHPVREWQRPLDNGWVAAKVGAEVRQLAILTLRNSGGVTYRDRELHRRPPLDHDIRDAVSAEFGSVPLSAVVEYLELLARIGAITIT